MTDRPNGMLTLDELAQAADDGSIDTVVAGFTDHYGRLVGKRFDVAFFLDTVALTGTHGCDYLLTVDMEMEPVAGHAFASWEQGYGDVHLVPDLPTLRRADWLDRTALVLCDVQHRDRAAFVAVAPRTVLRQQVDRLGDLALGAEAATELEHYLYRTPYREVAGGRLPEPAGWYREDYQLQQAARTEDVHATIRRHLARSGVPVESSKGEFGVGQHELNVRHADALAMADRHVVFKQCAKETADRLGVSITFMAKPAADDAGSSCHVHLSLWRAGRNAFVGDRDLGLDGLTGSDVLQGFVAGCLAHLPDLVLLLAPTVNSYKRFVDGSWAPTRLAWGHDNRTAGLRLVGHGESLRVECRIPGADCNPYLALAALLAAGRAGIADGLVPPPPFVGDHYAAEDLPHLPGTMRDAIDRFDDSSMARQAFGEEVVEHYVHVARTELAAFDAAVTDWERQRYFERI